MSGEAVEKYGVKPKARIVSQAVSGVSPEIMGIGPVSATKLALQESQFNIGGHWFN